MVTHFAHTFCEPIYTLYDVTLFSHFM